MELLFREHSFHLDAVHSTINIISVWVSRNYKLRVEQCVRCFENRENDLASVSILSSTGWVFLYDRQYRNKERPSEKEMVQMCSKGQPLPEEMYKEVEEYCLDRTQMILRDVT
jgi:hypothetical protein